MEQRFGGSVWHASAAPLPGWPADERFLRSCARAALHGVGSAALGEWEEWSELAYHIKRRMLPGEQALVGAPRDIRGTVEEMERLLPMARLLAAVRRG